MNNRVESITSIISLALCLVALAMIPWPGLWSPDRFANDGLWLVLWAGLEGAFLVPLLPGLLAGTPSLVRATVRDGQIGAAGRAIVWLAAGAGLVLGVPTWRDAPIYGLALVAVAAALPIAIGWGPFDGVPGFADSAAKQPIDLTGEPLVRQARTVRNIVLMLAALALALPLRALPTVAAWALLVGATLLTLFALQRLRGVWPRLSLPAALRFSWGRALPLAVAAIIYVVLLSWA